MKFPYLTMMQFAIECGKNGDLESLKNLCKIYPFNEELKLFYKLQLERANEQKTVHDDRGSSAVLGKINNDALSLEEKKET